MRGKTRYKRTCRAFGLALLLLALLAVPAYAAEEHQIFQVTEEDLTDLQVDLGEEGEVSLSDTTQEEWERMQQEVARNLEQHLSGFTINTTMPYTSDGEEVKEIAGKLYFNTLYNYPERTFFARTELEKIEYWANGNQLSLRLYPVYLPVNTAAYTAAVDAAYTACISQGMTDLEKVISAHDWLVTNCQYDPYIGTGGKYIASDGTVYNDEPAVYTSYGAFVNHNVVCQGYALAFKVLMDRAGIPCCYVKSDAMNHAWNMVQLDGNWYHVDVTWDDPSYVGIEDWTGRIKRENLLCSDAEITDAGSKGHHDWSTEWGYTCGTSLDSTEWEDAGDCPITYDPEQNAFLFYSNRVLYWCPVGTDFAAEKRVEILGNLSTAYAAAYDTKADIFYYAEYGGNVYEVDLTADQPSKEMLREGSGSIGLILRESTQVPGAMELCGRYAYATTWVLLVGMEGTDGTMPVQIRYPGTLERVEQLSGMGLEIRPTREGAEDCTVYLACYDQSGRMLGLCALGSVAASQSGSSFLTIPSDGVPGGTVSAKVLAVTGGGIPLSEQLAVGNAA